MINFLSEQSKKAVRKEYFFRVVVIFFGGLFFILMISGSFLIPSYFHSFYRNDVIVNQYENMKKFYSEEKNELFNDIILINQSIDALSLVKDNVISSEIIRQIVSSKEKDIKINTISLEYSNKTKNANITGISKTRESLIAFVKELKKSEIFKSVDLPVSNLIKNADIDFKINILIK